MKTRTLIWLLTFLILVQAVALGTVTYVLKDVLTLQVAHHHAIVAIGKILASGDIGNEPGISFSNLWQIAVLVKECQNARWVSPIKKERCVAQGIIRRGLLQPLDF